jgi:hypothetical protein
MTDIAGKTSIPPTMPFRATKVGYFDSALNMEAPATVFHDEVNDIVILALHAYEMVDGKPVATNNPMKTALASYHFYRSHGFDANGNPVFEYYPPALNPIKWGTAPTKSNTVELPYWLYEIACEFLAIKSKLREKLMTHGHLAF